MPLTEFLRMSKGRMDATQQRSSLSSDPSCRPETDFVELVWENGQIMMQGQSNNNNNKPRKGNSISNNFQQTLAPKPQEIRFNPNGSKMVKFSMMDDNSLPPCSEIGLDHIHDAEMVSWLNYPFEETLQNEYPTDFLRELSGVTINDFSNENLFKHGDPSSMAAVPSSSGQAKKHNNNNIPTSGVSAITGSNNNRSSQDAVFQKASSNRAVSSLRLPSTSSGFTNFPYISRHAALASRANANHLNSDDNKRCALSSNNNAAVSTLVNSSAGCCQKDAGSHNNNNQSAPQIPINRNSESSPPAKPPAEEVFSSNQPKEDAVAKNNVYATVAKPSERNVEPVAVAASSVGSGNSVERASTRDFKRKSRETESEGPSEEVEEESVGARKTPPNRTGSKRTRAAEVHNLSERRRRDRINEKMRALQELIPNCNKVDKASMLDEAIEYLKTLQLQVQMLSMGAGGLYMQPMMLPPGIQSPLQGAPHMPHFSPLMGFGMGYGFNMLDSSMKMMPFQGPHYGIPGAGPAFPGMPGSSLPTTFGRPGQGLPMAVHHRDPVLAGPTAVPSMNVNVNVPVGLSVSGVAGSITSAPPLGPTVCLTNVGQQMVHSKNVDRPLDPVPNQSTTEGTGNQAQAQAQAPANPGEVGVASSGTDAMPS